MTSEQQERSSLISQLQTILSPSQLIIDKEELRPYECDALSAYKKLPLAVALPESIEQIQQIMTTCSQLDVPVVARGAGTGLSGGALPHESGIVLGLSKLNKILDIDIKNQCARVQPGVRNLAITEAARAYDLYYAPDPSSQIACSIGGNVAENSGGVHCLKYGLTVHNILEVKMVTTDGELVTLGSLALDNPGYDLLGLINGSEGMLGIIVEIVVRLLPRTEKTNVIMAAFNKTENAATAVTDIIANGIIPAGLEMMDKLATQAAEAFIHANYPTEAEAILLCELDGSKIEVAEQSTLVKKLLEANNAISMTEANTTEQQAKLWAGRKSAFPAVGRLSPDYYCMDGTIPRHQIGYVLAQINELSSRFDLKVANVFHAGDGNLHPLILYDANIPGELKKAEDFGAEILKLSVDVGGTITGEHGVGSEKIEQMCYQFTDTELEYFHAVKAAFDPQSILNPGKVVPTLHRCAEVGRMHIHHGNLPHPELPRF
jgi:glycolate oxidase